MSHDSRKRTSERDHHGSGTADLLLAGACVLIASGLISVWNGFGENQPIGRELAVGIVLLLASVFIRRA